jgi:hypothetical protein
MNSAQINGQNVSSLILAEVVPPVTDQLASTSQIAVERVATDLSDEASVKQLITHKPDVIYHLAAIVSGEAESDMSKGVIYSMRSVSSMSRMVTPQKLFSHRLSPCMARPFLIRYMMSFS